MKIFKYFISKIFLRKAVLGISMILLLCMANYITFTSSRSILSTYQGYQETKYINQEGNYIANLDPDSHMDMGLINENGTQAVYSYLLILPIPKQPLRQYISRNLVQKIVMLPVPNH